MKKEEVIKEIEYYHRKMIESMIESKRFIIDEKTPWYPGYISKLKHLEFLLKLK